MSTLTPFLTVPEVAEIFRVSPHTIREWIATVPPRIPYCKLGGTVRFAPCDVCAAALNSTVGRRREDFAHTRFAVVLSRLIRDEVERQMAKLKAEGGQ